MANPSLKNGYISVANELVEKLATLSIPSSEMRIVWVVWRKTWGWQKGDRKKDWDWISISQFERLTGMKHANVVANTKSLVLKKILLKSDNGLMFNQNYEEWVVCKRIRGMQTHTGGSMQTHTKRGMQTHTHNRYKTTNTKESMKNTHFEEDSEIVPVDSSGEPITKKNKISPETKSLLMSIEKLWKQTAVSELGLDEKDVETKGIYFSVLDLYKREKFDKNGFLGLFQYFFKDKSVKFEQKQSFHLCMSRSYLTQYKMHLKKRSMNETNVSASNLLRL